jgi:hypothetical protein
MSKINYNRKTFLSKEELQRSQNFLSDLAFSKTLLMGITKNWGIVSGKRDAASQELRVTVDTNPGSIKIAPGYLVDRNHNLITVPGINQLPVPETGESYYVILSHDTVNWEVGTVSVDSSGNLNGVNTEFLAVLRGQGTQAPVNIRFVKEDGSETLNNGVYEVVEVINDTSAVINSYNSVAAEQNLKMIVVGTLPIGVNFTADQLKGLYTYDSYDRTKLLTVSVSGGLPAYTEGIDFPIAKVVNNNGVISVSDQDTLRKYWTI